MSKPARVAVLLLVLAVVALWAVGRTRHRRARASWSQPVAVAVYLLGPGPPGVASALQRSLDAIGAKLAADRARLVPGAGGPVLTFEVAGPVQPARLPPTEPPGPGLPDRALHALELWRATRAVHALTPDLDPEAFDVRVYLVVAAGEADQRFAEGLGEAGGEVGIVRARFDAGDPLLAAAAVVHEALHALGASDKYDGQGHALAPGGLAEPELAPPYPQRFAEIMVGEVPLAPGAGRLPASAAELAVGPATAAEIGWLPAAR